MEFQIEYSVVFRKIEENNGYEWKWWVVESLFIYIKTKIATKSKQKREDREQSFYCSQTLLFWDSIKHIIHGDRDSFGIDEEYIGFLLLEKVQTVLTPSTKYTLHGNISIYSTILISFCEQIKAIPQK